MKVILKTIGTLILVSCYNLSNSQSAPTMNSASEFSMVAASKIISNTPQVYCFGKIGLVDSVSLDIYGTGGVYVNNIVAQNAIVDVIDAKNQCAAMSGTTISNNLNNLSLNGGVYDVAGTSAQIVSTKASIVSLQQSITNLIAYNKTALNLAANTRILNADNTKAVNDGLITNAIIEQNEKDLHSVYLATIAKGIFTFTSSQSSIILGIAQQCPMSGGRAVPTARGFYEMIDGNMTYDDVATCLQEGIVLRNANTTNGTVAENIAMKKQTSFFKSYFVPNPAKQNATLFYQLDNTKVGVLYISNYLGQVVLKQVLKENENSVSISTGSLANGIYHFKVLSSGDEIGNGKLAVIK